MQQQMENNDGQHIELCYQYRDLTEVHFSTTECEATIRDFPSNFDRLDFRVQVFSVLAIISAFAGLGMAIIQVVWEPSAYSNFVMLTISIFAVFQSVADILDKTTDRKVKSAN